MKILINSIGKYKHMIIYKIILENNKSILQGLIGEDFIYEN